MKILRSDSAKPRASNRKTKPPTGTWYTAAKPAAAAEATNIGRTVCGMRIISARRPANSAPSSRGATSLPTGAPAPTATI